MTLTPLQTVQLAHATAWGKLSDARLDLIAAEEEVRHIEEEVRPGVVWDGWSPGLDDLRRARRRLAAATAQLDEAIVRERDTQRQLSAVTRLTMAQIPGRTGVSPARWAELVAAGQAPAPGGHTDDGTPWWTELSVHDWIDARDEQQVRV